jgi:hypothetical protein
MSSSCKVGANVRISLIYLTYFTGYLLLFQRFGRTFAVPFLTEIPLC